MLFPSLALLVFLYVLFFKVLAFVLLVIFRYRIAYKNLYQAWLFLIQSFSFTDFSKYSQDSHAVSMHFLLNDNINIFFSVVLDS